MRGAAAMATCVFPHRSPAGYAPAGPDTMAAWAAWFDSMGESLSDRGNPVFGSAKLGNCGAETRPGGYTFANTEDLESAAALAKGAPALEAGGGGEGGAIPGVNL